MRCCFKVREQHFLRIQVMSRSFTFGHKLAQYLDVTADVHHNALDRRGLCFERDRHGISQRMRL